MTDQLSGSEAAKAIGDPLGTVVGWWQDFARRPSADVALVIDGLCVLAAPFIYNYYLGLLAQGRGRKDR